MGLEPSSGLQPRQGTGFGNLQPSRTPPKTEAEDRKLLVFHFLRGEMYLSHFTGILELFGLQSTNSGTKATDDVVDAAQKVLLDSEPLACHFILGIRNFSKVLKTTVSENDLAKRTPRSPHATDKENLARRTRELRAARIPVPLLGTRDPPVFLARGAHIK